MEESQNFGEQQDNSHIFYDPFTILKPLASAVHLELDMINYVVCLLLSFAIGYWFKTQYSGADRQSRAIFTTTIGLGFCYFCYGNAIIHLLLNVFVSYALMLTIDPKIVHKVVFGFSMGYLLLIHFYRWMYQTSYCMDVTSSIMLSVGKTTLLATAIHDGMGKDPKKLSAAQEKDAVKEVPNVIDYASYMFNFQTILAGPMINYSGWSQFLDETHIPLDKTSGKPYDPTGTALEKLQIAVGFAVLYAALTPFFPMSLTIDPELNQRTVFIWWIYHTISCTVLRCQYYFAWILSDAACNASGFGFNGLDKESNAPKWTRATNVNPMKVEFAQNYKEIVDNWNMSTVAWLRRVVYERFDAKYRTWAVYATGAVWHGVSAGYYVSFLSSGLYTLAGAMWRRCMRHYFIKDPNVKIAYDIFGILLSRFILCYNQWPFYIMNLSPSLFTYTKFYFLPQIISLLIIFYLPEVFPPKKSDLKSEKTENTERTEKTDDLKSVKKYSSTRTAVEMEKKEEKIE